MGRRATSIAIAAAAAITVSAAGGAAVGATSGSAARVVEGARFAPLPAGWRLYTDDPVLLGRGGAHSDNFATSWNFRRSTSGGWLGNIPADAAGIEVLLVRRSTPATARSCGYPVRVPKYPLLPERPLRLRDLTRGPSDDNPRTLDLRLRANVRHLYTLDLIVEFGSTMPKPALRNAVDRALAALVLPSWPRGC